MQFPPSPARRELPRRIDGLIGRALAEIRNRRLQQEALQHLIQLLPTPNRETLYALLNFLSEVAANSEDRKAEDGEWLPGNKMDTNNLATVSMRPGSRGDVQRGVGSLTLGCLSCGRWIEWRCSESDTRFVT